MMTSGNTSSRRTIQRKGNDSGRKLTKQQEYSLLIGTPWARFITIKRNVSWRQEKHGSSCQENFLHGPSQKKKKDRLRQLRWEQHFSLDVKYEASAERMKESMKPCVPEWSSESRDRKRRELEQEQKTLADLRILCRMRPILDLIRTELSCKFGQTSR